MSAYNRLNGKIYLILGNHDLKNAKQQPPRHNRTRWKNYGKTTKTRLKNYEERLKSRWKKCNFATVQRIRLC